MQIGVSTGGISFKLGQGTSVLLDIAADVANGLHAGHEAGILQLNEAELLPPVFLGLRRGRDIYGLDCGQQIAETGLNGINVAAGDAIGPSICIAVLIASYKLLPVGKGVAVTAGQSLELLGLGIEQVVLLLVQRIHLLKLDQLFLHLQKLLNLLADAGRINDRKLAKAGHGCGKQ